MIAKEKWIEILKNFQESQIPEGIERDVEIPIETPLRRAITIIGPRRAGKTYIMYQLIRKIIQKEKKENLK
jgi:predicted AAA+ superfamily ATPase